MDFTASFLQSFTAPPKLSSACKPEAFLGSVYNAAYEEDSPLLKLLSGGSITASSPYSFDISSLDCFLLLYTQKGCGKLLIDGYVHTLAESSLLFFDCHKHFRFDIAIEPWEYLVFFIAGNELPAYYRMLPENKAAIMPVSALSETVFCLNRILVYQKKPETLSSRLSISSLLNSVITECIAFQLQEHASYIAPYLCEMKDLFDNHFMDSYSLDELEKRLHISKYKLCREFTAAFHVSPLQYLNRKRIEAAKHLLLTTSLKVHEVGSRVGIDNTNHFISLFRKFTGQTPLEYKQNKIL